MEIIVDPRLPDGFTVDLALDARGDYRVRVVRLRDHFVFLSKAAAFEKADLARLERAVIEGLRAGATPDGSAKWLRDGKAEPHVWARVERALGVNA